ncbi:uncharacterized protein LOC143289577 [Babylonia areolata]|uniref:uncharacterized protein LOC143289577 n=1 Tax=Babylonia areolata TaxID=304850 RepID=UPI003FCFAA95
MLDFRSRPYLYKQYPEIGKHYPGTWRVVDSEQLDGIVLRLTQPTRASVARAEDIRDRSTYVRSVVDTEKAKDITYRRPPQSAEPRLEGHHRSRSVISSSWSRKSGDSSTATTNADSRSLLRFRGSRKWDKTAWAHVRVRGTSPLS